MRTITVVALVAVFSALTSPASAQRLPFEQAFDVTGPAVLDVSTVRGKIDVTTGDPGKIVVAGAVTVRVNWDVPANALEIAQKVAAQPPIAREGDRLRLREPAGAVEQRAVTVSYDVRVPPGTQVLAVSESGATRIQRITGALTLRTQSGAIDVGQLGASAEISTGSGAVVVDGAAGPLAVTTGSSSITGRDLAGAVRVRTASGTVDLAFGGPGAADVETKSSAVRLRGMRGGVTVVTNSGAIVLDGVPDAPWTATTGSASVDVTFSPDARLELDAVSKSSSVRVEGLQVDGLSIKGRVSGKVRGGGPLVRIFTRSGSVRIRS